MATKCKSRRKTGRRTGRSKTCKIVRLKKGRTQKMCKRNGRWLFSK